MDIHAENFSYLSVEQAVTAVRAGKLVLISDDEGRENEADLCLAAQFADVTSINFIVHSACGLLCVALSGDRLDHLQLPLLEPFHNPLQGTAFTVSVDAHKDTTTGISVHDRVQTIRALIDSSTRPEDLGRPGHVFPLRARPGGTLERRGHTEASIDLMRIAGLEPGAVICELLAPDGSPAHGNYLRQWSQQEQIGIITVDAIARYREEQSVSLVAHTHLPTPEADFELRDYYELATGQQYLALTLGDLNDSALPPPLLRLHSACATGDIFGSQRCDCQAQLHAALTRIAQEGRGILLYLPQEGRGIGLAAKLQAYALQDQGYDTLAANQQLGYPVDARSYTTAISILGLLGIDRARLLTNSPRKIQALTDAGIQIERVALETEPTLDNQRYLQTKYERMGHMLTFMENVK